MKTVGKNVVSIEIVWHVSLVNDVVGPEPEFSGPLSHDPLSSLQESFLVAMSFVDVSPPDHRLEEENPGRTSRGPEGFRPGTRLGPESGSASTAMKTTAGEWPAMAARLPK